MGLIGTERMVAVIENHIKSFRNIFWNFDIQSKFFSNNVFVKEKWIIWLVKYPRKVLIFRSTIFSGFSRLWNNHCGSENEPCQEESDKNDKRNCCMDNDWQQLQVERNYSNYLSSSMILIFHFCSNVFLSNFFQISGCIKQYQQLGWKHQWKFRSAARRDGRFPHLSVWTMWREQIFLNINLVK